MAHILAGLRRVKAADIKEVLKADAARHAEPGLHLEHLWQNTDDPEEVFFLFRADDLMQAKRFVEKVHAQALNDDPHINMPQMTGSAIRKPRLVSGDKGRNGKKNLSLPGSPALRAGSFTFLEERWRAVI